MEMQFNHNLFERRPIFKSKTPAVKWFKEWYSSSSQLFVVFSNLESIVPVSRAKLSLLFGSQETLG